VKDLAKHILLWAIIATGPVSATASNAVGVDTAAYSNYSYIKFLDNTNDSVKLTDDEFFDIAGKVIFPVNKYQLPKNDSLLIELENVVFPKVNEDSLQLVRLIIRGAASPEGPTRFNKFLGNKRAEALLKFVKDHMAVEIQEDNFEMEIDIEDYRTLCLMMRRRGDGDYGYVQALCDIYLPKGRIDRLKTVLKEARQGRLWRRLYREYFPRLRAARVVFFFRDLREGFYSEEAAQRVVSILPDSLKLDFPEILPENPTVYNITQPRRELLSVKTNVLFDLAYMPGYDRWCPIPNLALEYYPLHGHFTFGASLDLPWWQDYDAHKYFQVRNWQLEARYYLRSGDIANNPVGQGAAFRGLYLQGYAHAGVFGICFDADRGWVGEGLGAGLGIGYVMPLSPKGHWRLEFGAQVGFFTCKYDPYQYENPVDPNYKDNLYYYKWTLKPDLFKKRQYRFNWIGPTRLGVTLSYDLLYRRAHSKWPSFKPWEPSSTYNSGNN